MFIIMNANMTPEQLIGCAMPGLKRRLYCAKKYMIHIYHIIKTKNSLSSLLKVIEKYTRPIDRPKLSLKMRMKSPINCESDDSESESEDSIDGVN